jgi:D-alanyl-D-alanine-carboxypeptidase/D-alanyl-D-alanine-endopeptidase
MTSTTFNLAPGDEANAMQGHDFFGAPLPFVPTPVSIECAAGLHATAADMQKFMAWHLDRDAAEDTEVRRMSHAAWLWRDGLTPLVGLDDAGEMAAMSLGWVVVAPEGTRPLILQKTGGLQGMFSYVAIAPERGVGVFTAMNAFSVGGFPLMVTTANNLIAELAPR